MISNKEIISEVENYYTKKVKEFGATAKGVDWNSEETQQLRFSELMKVVIPKENFTLLDYGCGYGALIDFIKTRYQDFYYTGFDISNEMLSTANQLYPGMANTNWINDLTGEHFDYLVASGIFNVKQDQENSKWETYIEETLIEMNTVSKKGFSFNVLTKYSDKAFMKEYLYYADPLYLFDYCKKHFSRNIALLHDYNLYEFTIIVRKEC